eukprot:165537-Prorocentrum_minimum.AAC.1
MSGSSVAGGRVVVRRRRHPKAAPARRGALLPNNIALTQLGCALQHHDSSRLSMFYLIHVRIWGVEYILAAIGTG